MTVLFVRFTYLLVPLFLWVHTIIPHLEGHPSLTQSEMSQKPIRNLSEVKMAPLHFDNAHIQSLLEKPNQAQLTIAPLSQYPELPRGCEVTSLAMLLESADIHVSKMTLAKEIKKDPTPFKRDDKGIVFGDPYVGFVGSMTNMSDPGYGVYHGPIADLAKTYLGSRVMDLTGESFSSILDQLRKGMPVWVISNVTFKKLPKNDFETWTTPEGQVTVTYEEHAVLLTGFDKNSLYINDPLDGQQNKKVDRNAFIESWIQMGSQAVSYS